MEKVVINEEKRNRWKESNKWKTRKWWKKVIDEEKGNGWGNN